jgi:hypothetical protein
MKVKKIAGVLLSIITALGILLLCIFLFWLGPTVKLAAEKVGSKALGAPLTINELSINPRKGIIHLSDFKIANHEEFGRTNVVSLASLDIAIDMGSIFSQTVIVHQVALNSPYFTYEQSSATDNITEFILSIQEFIGFDPAAPPAPPDPKKLEKERKKNEKKAQKKKEKGPKIVMVESLLFNDVQFHLANTDDPRMDIDAGFEQLAVSMTNGTVNLKNVHVSNPALLGTPNLFTLDAIDIDLDPESIYSDTVSIRDVQVIRPYAYLEHNPQTDTVAEFLKIAERFSTTTTNAPTEAVIDTPAEAEPEESTGGPPPIALHNLLVDDIQIKLLDTTATNASSEPRMLAGIGSISIRLVDGNIQIKGITVPNPEGFVSSNLFHLANIDITLEPGSIFSPQTVIQEIFVNSPLFNLEQTETSGNVSELKDTLMGFVPSVPEPKEAPTPKKPAMTGEEPKPIPLAEQPVVLHSLVVTNFAVNLSLPIATNAPASENVALDELNSLDRTSNTMTNDTEVAGTVGNEPLKLIAFNRLDVAPLNGTVRITNLQVSNPKGFANKHMVTLEQFKLDLDPDSLQSNTLLIRDILFDKPRIAYERKITTDNIKALQAEIEKAVSRRKENTPKEDPTVAMESPAEEAEGQKVIIEHLLVQDGLVKAKISALPSASIPLPNIEMKDMGKAEGGTSPGQAMSNIGGAFYDAIIGSVSSATGFAGDALKGAGGFTLGALGNVTGLTSSEAEPVAEDEAGTLADGKPSEEASQTAEPAEEKKPRTRRARRSSGRFF